MVCTFKSLRKVTNIDGRYIRTATRRNLKNNTELTVSRRNLWRRILECPAFKYKIISIDLSLQSSRGKSVIRSGNLPNKYKCLVRFYPLHFMYYILHYDFGLENILLSPAICSGYFLVSGFDTHKKI